ncbi:MAG TPA: AMP-binding protein [Jiangellaceae bacterium]
MFARHVDDEWRPVTSREFAAEVTSLAAGLIAAGIAPGDRIGVLSATRYEWTLCDFAILTAGAVTVPIYETSSVEQVEWILRDSGATAVLGGLDDGYLTIAGRKKDLIVTAAGKNIAAALYEDRLRAHWLIDQCPGR